MMRKLLLAGSLVTVTLMTVTQPSYGEQSIEALIPNFHTRQSEQLKGPVHSVTNESAASVYNSSGWTEGPRRFKHSAEYHQAGMQLKSIYYHDDGNVRALRAFQYDEKGRETKELLTQDGSTEQENVSYDTVERIVTYTTLGNNGLMQQRIESRYDEGGNEIERKTFYEEGKPFFSYRIRNSLSGLPVERLEYWKDGLPTAKSTLHYDEAENLVRIERYRFVGGIPSLIDTDHYSYESFDDNGNWTKRILKTDSSYDHDRYQIEYRSFTYYSRAIDNTNSAKDK